MLEKTINEAYLLDVAVPICHTPCSIITVRLQKYIDLKVHLTRIRQVKALCIVPLILSAISIIKKRLHDSLKVLHLRLGLYIVKYNVVKLKTCLIIRKFLKEQFLRSA
jgi:uncharacterized membrane protein YhaH (DUF805 family)